MSYKQIKPTTFDELTMNVFMLLTEFDPTTFSFETGIDASKILASTTGGVSFTDTPEYTDLGEDIDNCEKNTMELKHKEDGDVKISGTLVTLTPEIAKMMIGAADISGNKITPRSELSSSDFNTLWGLTDYGDGGILAIKMKRVLNTSGLSISTTDKEKSQIAFEFTCHKTLENPKDPAYEVYIITPSDTSGSVTINTHAETVAIGDTITLTAETVPAGKTVTWSSASTSVAEVTSGGVVSGVAAGNTVITASITIDGVTYTDTCTIIVPAAS